MIPLWTDLVDKQHFAVSELIRRYESCRHRRRSSIRGVKHFLKTGEGPILNQRIETTALRRDGTEFPVELAASAIRTGGTYTFYSFLRDITDRKKSEENLKDAIRARDEFISICSHELKTPVTSMKLQFQMAVRQLEKGDPSVQARESIEKRSYTAIRQLDRMTSLIEEMLDVSRISAGKLQLDKAPLDFHDLTHEVIERFSDQFVALGIPLEMRGKPVRAMVVGDRYRLEQVVSNLITNAIKYGSGRPIQISVAVVGEKVRLSVTDQGIGIAKENLERIFERFERAVRSSNISGLGLGLYISHQFVEAHGGRIEVDSEIGKGSIFTVELPLIPAA